MQNFYTFHSINDFLSFFLSFYHFERRLIVSIMSWQLYEELLVENESLKRAMRDMEERDKKRDQEVSRERRQMARKVSEMEEELQSLEQLKIDNQKLRDENGALIRVISKLST